ncbi:MAG: flagellar assembly protein FliH [Deltaproteobacteria bacterium]|nr:flagellar assembly protein FliH [Deltaproteobacteria bacterium]
MTRTPTFLERHVGSPRIVGPSYERPGPPFPDPVQPARRNCSADPTPTEPPRPGLDADLLFGDDTQTDAAPPCLETPAMPAAGNPPAPAGEAGTERVAHALETLKLHAHILAEAARADALEIGFEVARRILEHEVASNVGSLMGLVRTAIRGLADSRTLKVRVSPLDIPALEAAVREADDDLSLAHVELVGDATLSRGDVVVEGDMGVVDARLETRLREVRRVVAGALQGTDA